MWIRKYFFRIRIRGTVFHNYTDPDLEGQLITGSAGTGCYLGFFEAIEKQHVVKYAVRN
jgi:hypothetical protein